MNDNPIHLLNDPWSTFERHQRREALSRFCWFVLYSAACILLGVAFGMIACQ